MIEGFYVTHPSSQDDHMFNYFVSVLEAAYHYGGISVDDAIDLIAEFKEADGQTSPKLVPELGGVVANSTRVPLNRVVSIVFQEHENCTSGWL